MKITFDNSARIAGIGLVPWTRLGPERWFSNYKITGLYGWDLGGLPGAPEVIALSDQQYGMPHLEKLNTPRLLESPEFQQLALDHFKDYSFITYKPVDPPQALLDAGCRFLSMNLSLKTTLENKVEFRRQFAELGIPFPAYDIYERASLTADKAGLERILKGRSQVILQDESLGGGRGTFRVHDVASLTDALESIESLEGGTRVVVSEMIQPASERSVQAVSTRYGVFVGPLQKQIVGHPLLCNLETRDGDRFCGAEISASDPLLAVYPQLRDYAVKIGERLRELGYKGVFGVDALVDEAGKLYILEVNPRLTGLTPLLTMLYREGHDIPFYLLHILELGGYDYEITDPYVDPVPAEGGLLVLHALNTKRNFIKHTPESGLYDMQTMAFKHQQYRLSETPASRELLLQQYMPPGFNGRPGGRLMTAYVNGRILDDKDNLLPDVAKAVTSVLDQIIIEEVDEYEHSRPA